MNSFNLRGLTWWPDKGYGFFPAKPEGKYDLDYWRKYMGYKETSAGEEISKFRISFTDHHCANELIVDIGIGCGHFIEARGMSKTFGYDVNPIGVRWLLDKGIWYDPYAADPKNVSFWDSLEHMARPADLVKRVSGWVFISIPIFSGPEHVLRSKHFRKDEHFWYFSEAGLIDWMKALGFQMIDSNRMEEEYGREDIGTYSFNRTTPMPEVPA
jgi:hypothetical protein